MLTMVSHDISVFIFTAPRDERSEQTCRQTYMGHAHIHTYTVYILVHLILTGLMDSLLYVLNSLFLAFVSSSVALQLVVTEYRGKE